MPMHRLLPEAAYDWIVRDGRDGEEWGPFDTKAAASEERKRRARPLPFYARPAIEVVTKINERKVLALMAKGR